MLVMIVRTSVPMLAIAFGLLAGCDQSGEQEPAATQAAELTMPPERPSPRTGYPARVEDVVAAPPSEVIHAADPGDGVLSAEGVYYVTWSTEPAAIPLNEPFAVNVQIRDASDRTRLIDDARFDIDARMPHHRHGMFNEPEITSSSPGTFAAQGMLFHMPGRWEIHFDVTRSGVTERAQCVIELE